MLKQEITCDGCKKPIEPRSGFSDYTGCLTLTRPASSFTSSSSAYSVIGDICHFCSMKCLAEWASK